MALLKILIFPDPRLRTKAKPVLNIDGSIKELSDDMLETMYEGEGLGLAATQINVHKRIIVVDITKEKNEPQVLINPEIKKIIDPEKRTYSEGCLSVPGFYEELKRPSSVEVSYQDLEGKMNTEVISGLLSVVIQHEIDHLDGKIMVDSLSNLKREMIRKKLLKNVASK